MVKVTGTRARKVRNFLNLTDECIMTAISHPQLFDYFKTCQKSFSLATQ